MHSVNSRLDSWRDERPSTQARLPLLLPLHPSLSIDSESSRFRNNGPYEPRGIPGPTPDQPQPQTPWARPGNPHFDKSQWEPCSAYGARHIPELAPNGRLHSGEDLGETQPLAHRHSFIKMQGPVVGSDSSGNQLA